MNYLLARRLWMSRKLEGDTARTTDWSGPKKKCSTFLQKLSLPAFICTFPMLLNKIKYYHYSYLTDSTWDRACFPWKLFSIRQHIDSANSLWKQLIDIWKLVNFPKFNEKAYYPVLSFSLLPWKDNDRQHLQCALSIWESYRAGIGREEGPLILLLFHCRCRLLLNSHWTWRLASMEFKTNWYCQLKGAGQELFIKWRVCVCVSACTYKTKQTKAKTHHHQQP